MTDIVERLRESAVNGLVSEADAMAAADEIERLRNTIKNCPPVSESEYVRRLEDEIERLEGICRAQQGEVINKLHDEIERLKAEVSLHVREAEDMRKMLERLDGAAGEIERLRNTIKNCPPVSESEYVKRLEDEIERLEAKARQLASTLATRMLDTSKDKEIERWEAKYDDYVMRANANVCDLNRDIERLRAALSNIHEHAIMGHDDAADGFIKIAGMVRDALNMQAGMWAIIALGTKENITEARRIAEAALNIQHSKTYEAGPDECETGVALTQAIDDVLAEDDAALAAAKRGNDADC